jgi:hypothetical protein
MFSIRSVQRGYKEDNWSKNSQLNVKLWREDSVVICKVWKSEIVL